MRNVVIVAVLILAHVACAAAGTRSKSVLVGPVEVAALSSKPFTVLVTEEMPGARLKGAIRASGGTGNDIDLLVMNEKDFANWSNGHPVSVHFQSGKQTLIELDVPLPPGTHRIVFSNTFSSFTPKVIQGEINLLWDEEPGLPSGKSLRDEVKFVKLTDEQRDITLAVRTPSGPGQIRVRGSAGVLGEFTVTLRRPQGNTTLERVLGSISASSILEAGTVDVDGDGTDDAYLVGRSSGSGAATDDLVIASSGKLALVSLSIAKTYTAGSKADVIAGDNFEDPRFAKEQSFLHRMADAYVSSSEDLHARENDPAAIFDLWVADNGKVTDGPMTIRRFKGEPVDQGTVENELVVGDITYRAHFKSGVIAYDRSTQEHYALFYPTDQYAWASVLKMLGPHLLIGTKGEGLSIVDTRTFRLRRVPIGGAGSDVESIAIVGTKIRINGTVDIDAPEY